jgi:hypothetical protein
MKNFDDFVESLDVAFYANIEKDLMTIPEVINAPTVSARIHAESEIITLKLLQKYHEWLG